MRFTSRTGNRSGLLQRWRGSVKDRHFVLALREYFREKLDLLKKADESDSPSTPSHRVSEEDEWSMEYIHITRVQPIIEAFDDDGSGFITVQEVNAFTTARPKNWRYAARFRLVIERSS